MGKIEDWRKRLSKIQDRIYLMKENVQLFDLPDLELTKSVSMIENLKEEMKIAIRDIEEQDEVRGFQRQRKQG